MVVPVVDKPLLRWRLARAHARRDPSAMFLLDTVIAELGERLSGVERRFPIAVAAGGQTPALAGTLTGSGKVGAVFRLEQTAGAFRTDDPLGAVADEEGLPLAPASIDLFASTLGLQWANDLVGALIQIRRSLKPDGLFLGAVIGGGTLTELRESLIQAETEIRGGASPRVLPTADVRKLGQLLQRAGFALPVADRDILTIRYASAFRLYADLQAMGATNALVHRDRTPISRRLLSRTAEIYAERFSDPDRRVRATFEIVWLSGWAPHESQQQPSRRGSGQVSLAEALRGKTFFR